MSSVAQLKVARGQVKSAITRAQKYIDGLDPTTIDVYQLRSRKEAVLHKLSDFNELQDKIEALDELAEHESDRVNFENAYFALISQFDHLLEGSSNPPPSPTRSSESAGAGQQIRLPKIDLPHFKGSYEDWYSFYDTFSSLIHNNPSLSQIQKFHYLKSSLKGDAAAVINSLEISALNYYEAWKMLQNRYDNKRLIVHTHLKALTEIPMLSRENSVLLRQLLDTVLKHTRSLKALKRPVDQWDDWLVHITASKLDSITLKEWEKTLASSTLPTFRQFVEFLTQRCQVLEAIAERPSAAPAVKAQRPSRSQGLATHVSTNGCTCPICRGNHFIHQCEKFSKMPVRQRVKEAMSKKLCLNCLRSTSHFASSCTSSACKRCDKRHNTLLHISEESPPNSSKDAEKPAAIDETPPPLPTVNCMSRECASPQVYLSTALVQVFDTSGNSVLARALLDSCAQSSFITEGLASRLKLPRKNVDMPIAGIGQSAARAHQRVTVKFQSRHNTYNRSMDCFILRSITQNLPSVSINGDNFHVPRNLKLADPTFHLTGPIDLLIGVEHFFDLLCVGQIRANGKHPCLQKTQLGWVVSGRRQGYDASVDRVVCNLATDGPLDALLTKFWQLDDFACNSTLTPEGRDCEAHFKETVKLERGRFIVQLPVKDGQLDSLGESRPIALKRFYNLERRLNKQPALRQEYAKFMNEYIKLGHMKAVAEEPKDKAYYMPHHAVEKQTSLTTKLRVVFDASCRSSSGVSLNDALKVGPTIQQDLFSIIARFRTFAYVLTGDIAKMYRQVLVDESQTSLQRILWRDSTDEPVQAYELITVTYGTAPASFLATRCLHEIADRNSARFPQGAAIIKRDFYVDDLLTGANSLSEALRIRDETVRVLEQAGFDLRKWSANTPDLLTGITDQSDQNLILNKDDDVRTLGVQWNPTKDIFQCSVPAAFPSQRVTKRSILSCIARLFDPLGLLAPVVITAKIIIQQLWREGSDWDESVPVAIHTKWTKYQEQLPRLNELQIGRHVVQRGAARVRLHGFSDASEAAYGACVYIVSGDSDGNFTGELLCAKSRVAPLKNISMPRLELCGALLLARLVDRVKSIVCMPLERVYCWTDSTIVLAWLKSPSRTWTTFVANRVGEIQELLPGVEWGHVPTNHNPADVLSRGATPDELHAHALWWKGPIALFNPVSGSADAIPLTADDDLPERRRALIACVSAAEDDSRGEFLWTVFTRYSTLTRLARVAAYCFRFVYNASRAPNERRTGPLLQSEIAQAVLKLVIGCQAIAFRDELKNLGSGREISSGSRVTSLSPFIDETGILRVGGRLRNSDLPYSGKHPILLPKSHPLTELIIRHEHVRHLHAGPQLTLAAVRSNYWPISGRSTVRNIVSKCVTCFRHAPVSLKYIMGDLPAHRVTPSRPFERVGLDYCGPFHVREGKRRNAKLSKAYVAIFVCMSTKAVHIELVSDMTTEAFLASLKRFIARRGKPSDVYSDNGSNFVGANRELREMWAEVFGNENRRRTLELLCNEGLTWHFIPPGAPHFGGLWEAAVRASKHHLKRVAGNSSLRFEELYTLLVQVEAVLNSRPLTPISSDPNDLTFLTPGHFLIGDSLLSTVEPNLTELPDNRLSRWQHLEKLRQHFWQRWSAEYLNLLHQRPRGATRTRQPLEEGHMVVVRDDHLPPLRWLLGRVTTTLPGKDGVVRAALIRTSKGTIKRPTAKLCILPIKL